VSPVAQPRPRTAGRPAARRQILAGLAALRDPELTPPQPLRKELHQRFVEAIDRLEDEDREILLMHFEQLTNSETAEPLGLSQPPPACGTCGPWPPARGAGETGEDASGQLGP
jgi:hypothetical protein